MKCAIFTLVALALFVLAAEGADNLVANPDMSVDNGIGIPAGWRADIYPPELGGSINVHPTTDGVFALSVHGEKAKYLWQQAGLALLPKGKYALSCDVRTTGSAGAKFCIYVRNKEWNSPKGSIRVFDTKGEWKSFSVTIEANATKQPDKYAIVMECVPGEVKDVCVEMRNLSLVPTGEAEKKVSRSIDPARMKPLPSRIVPIDPLLSRVDAKTGRMGFYWPGADRTGRDSRLVCTLDGDKFVSAPFATNGYASVMLGRMKTGEHRIAIVAQDKHGSTVASNAYRIVAGAWPDPAKVGRRLNNFVTELVNAPLQDRDYEFVRATDGWIWISFDGNAGDAQGFLDGGLDAVVRRRPNERGLETQRFVTSGRHFLSVRGAVGGRLRIHAVGPILCNPVAWGMANCEFNKVGSFKFGRAFARRYGFLTTANTYSGGTKLLADPFSNEAGVYLERGIQLMTSCRLPPQHAVRDTVRGTYDFMRRTLWLGGPPTTIDENNLRAEPRQTVTFSEAAWRIVDEMPGQQINLNYADTSTGAYYNEPRQNVSEIASIVNSGDGRGLLMPELYFPVTPTRAGLTPYLDGTAELVQAAERMVPAAKGKVLLYLASYITLGGWSNYYSPEADCKVQLAEELRTFACDPRFAGCSGVAFGGVGYGEEEYRRWGMMLLRHYALEGGTADLSAQYGFAWNPGFVRNPDFADGLSDWAVASAKEGSLVAETITGYGTGWQGRVGAPRGCGDTVATFVSVADGTNMLSQRLTGLENGAYYSLQFVVCDRTSMEKGIDKANRPKLGLSVRLEGGTEIKELYFNHETMRRPRRVGSNIPTFLHVVRCVFRADSETATLVFADHNADGTALLPVGQRQSLNYIVFRRYFIEKCEDVMDIVAAIRGGEAK